MRNLIYYYQPNNASKQTIFSRKCLYNFLSRSNKNWNYFQNL